MTREFQDIFTPDELTSELLDHMPISSGMDILEPSAGNGNMIKSVIDRVDGVSIVAVELQLKHVIDMKNRFKDIDNLSLKIQELPSVFDIFF